MKLIGAFLALLLLAAAQPARDWRQTAVRTPAGAHVIGNPAARVKLIEYASYTCPACAQFAAESGTVLKDRMIRSGTASLEYHHLIRDALDLGAAVVARCGGPRQFSSMSDAIFAAQGQWLARGIQFQQANAAILQTYAQLDQVRALADGAGLTALAQTRGLAPATIDRCFADRAEIDRILAMTAATPREVTGTPTFYVNGKLVARVGWAGLEPVLKATGAR